jgi:uncharacterized membrane protein YedE/YeeE
MSSFANLVGVPEVSGWAERAVAPLVGGMLIGAAAVLLLSTLGRIAGISGILGNLLPLPRVNAPFEMGWRLAFLLGLITVGVVARLVYPPALTDDAVSTSTLSLVIAGLLVGFGTRLGSGCTSGHGVCGVSRLSPRSLVATVTFITFGALTVALRSLGVQS